MTAMIAMMTMMIILDQGQSYYCLVFVRKALERPRVAKPPKYFDHGNDNKVGDYDDMMMII